MVNGTVSSSGHWKSFAGCFPAFHRIGRQMSSSVRMLSVPSSEEPDCSKALLKVEYACCRWSVDRFVLICSVEAVSPRDVRVAVVGFE